MTWPAAAGYYVPVTPPPPTPPAEFIAACPGCGAAVPWVQRFASTAVPGDFTIDCDCESDAVPA